MRLRPFNYECGHLGPAFSEAPFWFTRIVTVIFIIKVSQTRHISRQCVQFISAKTNTFWQLQWHWHQSSQSRSVMSAHLSWNPDSYAAAKG